jgi:hypothetical protein
MSRYARRSKIRWRSREGPHQTVIVVAMAALLSFGLLQLGELIAQSQRVTAGENVVAASPSDDEIYTGSILFPTIKAEFVTSSCSTIAVGELATTGPSIVSVFNSPRTSRAGAFHGRVPSALHFAIAEPQARCSRRPFPRSTRAAGNGGRSLSCP